MPLVAGTSGPKDGGAAVSHVVGTVQVLGTPFQTGPDTGQAPSSPNTWADTLATTPAPNGTKFVILHFQNASLPANNRLEVDLGYDTDVFTAADGADFWTRPVMKASTRIGSCSWGARRALSQNARSTDALCASPLAGSAAIATRREH